MTSLFSWRAAGALGVLSAAMLSACAPALNWRVVQPADGLSLMLPCKPSERKETVRLGEQDTELTMIGCQAKGMDFTHTQMPLPTGVLPAVVIERWQQASLRPLGAHEAQAPKPQPLAGVVTPGVGVRVKTTSGLQVQLVWWHQGSLVHQLAVYAPLGEKSFENAVDAFISSIQQRP